MALPEASDRVPTPFGPYLLDAPIAEGGMARVYRARLRGALGFEKPLVVKQVRPELAREPRFVEMFAREAKALVRLVHPHIVPIYELGVVDGVYFIAMEHIEGATLEGALGEGPLAPGPAAHLGIQVAEALQHAHERHDLVHRDVTPRNVMVDEGGHARLLDFGIATPAEGSDGDVFGTPGYLSPEQARGQEVGPPSDVFSLGCVLARAMTGEAPFPGDAGRERLLAGERPTFEGLPEPLVELLDRMLATDPEDRPSAAEVARGLRTWLAGAHPEGVAAVVAERARRVKEREPEVVTTGESTAAVGKVRTLATSALLEDVRPSEPIPAEETHEATQPIEGRRGRVDSEPDSDSALGSRDPEVGSRQSAPDSALGSRDSEVGSRQSASDSALGSRDSEVGSRGSDSEVGSRGSDSEVGSRGSDSGSASGSESESESESGSESESAPTRWVLVALALLGVGVAVALGLRAEQPVVDPSAAGTGDSRPTMEAEPAEPESPEPSMRPEPAAETAMASTATMEAEAPEPAAVTMAAPAARASLRITAAPWAEVRLDRRALGTTPVRGITVPAGTHRIHFECPPLGVSVDHAVTLEPGDDRAVFADLEADPPRVTVR